MPLAQALLAHATGSKRLEPGEHIEIEPDVVFLHEALGKAIAKFEELEEKGAVIRYPERVIVVLDHWAPAPNVDSAIGHRSIRGFVKRMGIENFYDVGRHGICHQLVAEEGFVLPGNIVVGSDSHALTLGALGAFAVGMGPTDIIGTMIDGKTWLKVPSSIGIEVTGRLEGPVAAKDLALHVLGMLGTGKAEGMALEYHGPGTRAIDISGRFTVSNMAAETGAFTCLFPTDGVTGAFLKKRSRKPFFLSSIGPSGPFKRTVEVDAGELEPLVAAPPDPSTVGPVRDMQGIPIDQVYIGSCTNGRLEDLMAAADILKGEKVSKDTRLIVSPASQRTYLAALRKGVITRFIEAGGIVISPGCNACFGGHQGILADGESCLSTTNRNFAGRMGSSGAKVYLASPATAAATALKGVLTDPRDV
jgi:3-isopropylmalate/(R)-2-methylmalate dehydratase large subunit